MGKNLLHIFEQVVHDSLELAYMFDKNHPCHSFKRLCFSKSITRRNNSETDPFLSSIPAINTPNLDQSYRQQVSLKKNHIILMGPGQNPGFHPSLDPKQGSCMHRLVPRPLCFHSPQQLLQTLPILLQIPPFRASPSADNLSSCFTETRGHDQV